MAYNNIGLGAIFAPYVPTQEWPHPGFGERITLTQLTEYCLFIDERHIPTDVEKTTAFLKVYTGFKPFIDLSSMRDLVYNLKTWQIKLFELRMEKRDIHPSHKDWALLKKSISDLTAKCKDEYETYLVMLKLNGIDYDYFKFVLEE